ncbi:MAG TPA: hypothetical protein VG167_18540 [Verrucomicrobiae bacterium]|nr:hypothetical protein [Verrucomicrobiae bacterium]
MTQKYGDDVTPYLENAWRVIEEETKAEQTAADLLKCSTLYHMVAPGRFVPVSRETFVTDKALKRFKERNLTPLTKLYRLAGPKTIVALFSALFVLAGLCPPWVQVGTTSSNFRSRLDAGYHPILSPPEAASRFAAVQIDTSRLVVEWLCILVAALAVWFVFRRVNSQPADNRRA